MFTLRDGKQATTSNAQLGKPCASKRISKRAAAESQETEKVNKRPKVAESEREAQDQKHDSGGLFGKSADTGEINANDQSKDTPVRSENEEARETRELDEQVPAQKNAANVAEFKWENEKRPARSRDRIPTPGRTHAAVADFSARDNLTDPSSLSEKQTGSNKDSTISLAEKVQSQLHSKTSILFETRS